MRRCAWMLVFLVLSSPIPVAVRAAASRAIEVEARPVATSSRAAADGRVRIGDLVLLTGLELSAADPGFGGFSGLLVSGDGTRLLALSDRGAVLDAVLKLDDAGLPAGIAEARLFPLRDPDGTPLRGDYRDAEALIGSDRGVLIAFEFDHRVMAYGTDRLWDFPSPLKDLLPERLPLPREVLRHPANGGLEAGVFLPDGRLLLFSEEARAEAPGARRAWLIETDFSARPLAYRPPEDGFGATDAALLPDGDVLLLLRRFSPFQGLSVEVRRIPGADIRRGAPLSGKAVARFETSHRIDNMEGIAVRADKKGRTLVYLISDDNFNIFQRTLLLVFLLAGEA